MPRDNILEPGKSYTFRSYFDMAYEPDDGQRAQRYLEAAEQICSVTVRPQTGKAVLANARIAS